MGERRWFSSKILLLMVCCWTGGLALIHHFYLVPSIRSDLARRETGEAVSWIHQSLSGLAGERQALQQTCRILVEGGLRRLNNRPATQPGQPDDTIAVLVCSRQMKVSAMHGWIAEPTPLRSGPVWDVGESLAGGAVFPASWSQPEFGGLMKVDGRICLFARRPIGGAHGGYAVLIQPIDWPMLRRMSATVGAEVRVFDFPAPASPSRSHASPEGITHWSSGHDELTAEMTLKDTLGALVGRLQVASASSTRRELGEIVNSAYMVQLFWLILFGVITFTAVYWLFIRPLAILVRRLGDVNVTAARDKLPSGLVAETAILAQRFSDVLDRVVLLSETDGLTGLTNRRQFQILLEHEFHISRRHATPLTVLMIDVDHFKRVNDEHGHLVGDEVLRMVAETVRAMARRSDVCARYGGEEFAVIMPQTTQDQAVVLADRIRQEISRRTTDRPTGRLRVTVSIGAGGIPDLSCRRCEELVDYADKALYHAKRTGRNRVVAASALTPSK